MPLAFPHLGWHLTYFMHNTWEIVNKMRSNSHARQNGLFKGLPSDWREREATQQREAGYEVVLKQKISTCTPFNAPACWTQDCNHTAQRPYSEVVTWAALPSLHGWPKHPTVDHDQIAIEYARYASTQAVAAPNRSHSKPSAAHSKPPAAQSKLSVAAARGRSREPGASARGADGTSDGTSDGTTRLCTMPRACMHTDPRRHTPTPLLVYHPQSGLSNTLFGLASAALLATTLCRRFAVAWGTKANPQAGASFDRLFQRPAGFEFLSADDGKGVLEAFGSRAPIRRRRCS